MKSVSTRSTAGRRAAAGTVLALTAATLGLGLAGPASAANTIELQGTVTDAAGAPLGNALVSVFTAATGAPIDDIVPSRDGTSSFAALPAGPVKVEFEAEDP